MIRVGIIRGGTSPEYEVSLQTGAHIMRNLPDAYKPVDILVDRAGAWHLNGLAVTPDKLSSSVDMIWNALHGGGGENGSDLSIVRNLSIAHTGPTPFGGALSLNKKFAKEHFRMLGLKTPESIAIVPLDETDFEGTFEEYVALSVQKVFRTVPPTWVVKPTSSGSSLGVSIVETLPSLAEALATALADGTEILVEHFVDGREVTVGVIPGFRGQETYVLPPLEILKNKNFLDYESRMTGDYDMRPAFSHHKQSESKKLEDYARQIHRSLGLGSYASVDFIVTPRGVYVLEVDAQPALHEHSPFHKSLVHVGATMKEFAQHVINTTLKQQPF